MSRPRYVVEGRWFLAYSHAEAFANNLADEMGRPVQLLEKIDDMTPAAVVFTAKPEQRR